MRAGSVACGPSQAECHHGTDAYCVDGDKNRNRNSKTAGHDELLCRSVGAQSQITIALFIPQVTT
jgi:hypothetical protein